MSLQVLKAKLPPVATGDDHEISTYPEMLLARWAGVIVHIDDGNMNYSGLCGVGCTNIVEHISHARPRRVCRKCRRIWEAKPVLTQEGE